MIRCFIDAQANELQRKNYALIRNLPEDSSWVTINNYDSSNCFYNNNYYNNDYDNDYE